MSASVLGVIVVLLAIIVVRLLVKVHRLEGSIALEREDAVETFKKRSGRTRVGTAVEQMVPFMEGFPYDASDARFIGGGPVDYVIFDGLTDGEIRELVFLDVKTGKSKTNGAQKLVQRCADLGHVRFGIFRVDPQGKATLKLSRRVDEVLEPMEDEVRRSRLFGG